MKSVKTSKLITLALIGALFIGCTSGKYCVGGKKKYKHMKKDTNLMVF